MTVESENCKTMGEAEFGPVVVGATSPRELILKWAIASVLSFLAVWAIASLLVDQPLVYVWDDEVERIVVEPGSYLSANEGYSVTKFGRFGLSGIADAEETISQANGNWIAVWGDSYVEAKSVDDGEKMTNVAQRIWDSEENESLAIIGIGMGGWTLADIYYHLPTYERLLGAPKLHVIVISESAEFTPDRFEREAMFVSEPEFGFKPSTWKPKHTKIKRTLSSLRMGFAWEMMRESSDMKLRFQPGPTPKSPPRVRKPPERDAVEFLVKSFQDRTEKPISFLMLSRVPTLRKRELQITDPLGECTAVVKEVANEYGVPVETMYDAFIEFAKEKKAFPRTFWSRYRGGHLNKDGHRLVAENLVQMAREIPASSNN